MYGSRSSRQQLGHLLPTLFSPPPPIITEYDVSEGEGQRIRDSRLGQELSSSWTLAIASSAAYLYSRIRHHLNCQGETYSRLSASQVTIDGWFLHRASSRDALFYILHICSIRGRPTRTTSDAVFDKHCVKRAGHVARLVRNAPFVYLSRCPSVRSCRDRLCSIPTPILSILLVSRRFVFPQRALVSILLSTISRSASDTRLLSSTRRHHGRDLRRYRCLPPQTSTYPTHPPCRAGGLNTCQRTSAKRMNHSCVVWLQILYNGEAVLINTPSKADPPESARTSGAEWCSTVRA